MATYELNYDKKMVNSHYDHDSIHLSDIYESLDDEFIPVGIDGEFEIYFNGKWVSSYRIPKHLQSEIRKDMLTHVTVHPTPITKWYRVRFDPPFHREAMPLDRLEGETNEEMLFRARAQVTTCFTVEEI